MKNLFFIILFGLFIYSCSSNDDGDTMDDPQLNTGHFSLRLNGAGFSDQRVEVFRDTINPTGNKIIFSSSDDLGNGFSFAIPQPLETVQYSIGEYEFVNPSWAVYSGSNSGLFYSENGTVIISGIIDNGENCSNIQGNLSIDFSLNGDENEILNIQGTFDVPTFNCE